MFFIMMLLTKVHSIQIRGRKMIKIKDGEVRLRGMYGRTMFGYIPDTEGYAK